MRSLLFSPYGYYSNLSQVSPQASFQAAASFAYLFSRYLNSLHTETYQFACDGVLTECAQDLLNTKSRNQLCNNCRLEQKKMANWAQLKTLSTSEFLDSEFKAELTHGQLSELKVTTKPAATMAYALEQAINLYKIDLLIVPYVNDIITEFVISRLKDFRCHYLVFSAQDHGIEVTSSFCTEMQVVECYLEDILDFRSDPLTWDDYYLQAVTSLISTIGIDINQLKLPI